MKIRDYLFWTVLTCVSAVLGASFRERVTHAAHPGTYWLALLRLARAAPQMRPPAGIETVQELPDAVVNAPPDRRIDAQGIPLIDHGAGW